MCVTFLIVKKSNQKPSGDVYSLGCNVLKSNKWRLFGDTSGYNIEV